MEYQHTLSERIDLCLGSSIAVFNAVRDSAEQSPRDSVRARLVAGFAGIRGWPQRGDDKPFGTNIFGGLHVGYNMEFTTWSQVGVEIGSTPHVRHNRFCFGLPAKLGLGVGEGSVYAHGGMGLEVSYTGTRVGAGARGFLTYSPKFQSLYGGTLFYHFPISATAFVCWSFGDADR
jgi:hypothetical protein